MNGINRVYSVFRDPPLCTKYALFCHSQSGGYYNGKVLRYSALACPPVLKILKAQDFVPFILLIASFEAIAFSSIFILSLSFVPLIYHIFCCLSIANFKNI
jgi:hypothetical protein